VTPPYGYGQQPYYGAPPQPQNNTLGLVGMILGIVSIPLALCCTFMGIPLGIAAVVLGILGKQKADRGLANNRGQAIAGLACGAAGIALSVLWIILSVALNVGTMGYTY
jgi:hypothetical protein